MPTKYYRIEDPVENFKIRVVVREISKARKVSDNGGKSDPYYNDSVISWQQKLYSPSEIYDYMKNKNQRSGTAGKYEAKRYFASLEDKGINIHDMIDDTMMYTYIDRDHYGLTNPPPLHDPGSQEPYIGSAVRNTGTNYVDLNKRQHDLTNRLFRERPFKSMYICLATDVNEGGLANHAHIITADTAEEDREKPFDNPELEPLDPMNNNNDQPISAVEAAQTARNMSSAFKEHILCCIKLYQDGVLEVSPSFSNILEEDTPTAIAQEGNSMAPFLEDATAEAGLRKGFKLTSFRIRSSLGTEYEYVIQNVNDILIPHQIEQIERKIRYQNSIKAIENRGIIGAENWKQDPSHRDKTIGIYAEIVSAKNFDTNFPLFITYELSIPHNYSLRKGDLSDGVADVAKDLSINKTITANNNQNNKAETLGDDGMLYGCTQSATISQAVRMNLKLPQHRPNWQGVQLAFGFSCGLGEPTRIVLGMFYFLLTIIAVLLGCSYPFWVIPGLVILFITGLGPPGSAPAIVIVKNNTLTNIKDQYQNSNNKMRNDRNRLVIDDSTIHNSPVAVFNHLMRFSFDVSDIAPAAYTSTAPSAYFPTLVFQVYSRNWFGRYTVEGYGYHHITEKPGYSDIQIKTWKPVGGIRDKMEEFFLGNSLSLKDNAFIESFNKTSVALNKFGVLTQSAGSVRVRVHVVETDARIISEQYREQSEVVTQAESSNKVKRTVDDILKSFKTSLRPSASRESLGIAALNTPSKKQLDSTGNRPSISSIMSSLSISNKEKDNKVAEILARARAKAGGNTNSNTNTTNNNSMNAMKLLSSSNNNRNSIPNSNSMYKKGLGAYIDSPLITSTTTTSTNSNQPAAYDPYINSTTTNSSNTNNITSQNRSSSSNQGSVVSGNHGVPPLGAISKSMKHRYDDTNLMNRESDENEDNEESSLLS